MGLLSGPGSHQADLILSNSKSRRKWHWMATLQHSHCCIIFFPSVETISFHSSIRLPSQKVKVEEQRGSPRPELRSQGAKHKQIQNMRLWVKCGLCKSASCHWLYMQDFIQSITNLTWASKGSHRVYLNMWFGLQDAACSTERKKHIIIRLLLYAPVCWLAPQQKKHTFNSYN